jgi:hypothetical protein
MVVNQLGFWNKIYPSYSYESETDEQRRERIRKELEERRQAEERRRREKQAQVEERRRRLEQGIYILCILISLFVS